MSVKTEPVSELERIFYEGAQRKDWHLKAFKNPKEIAEAVRDSAVKKAHVHPLRLIILGILAGSTPTVSCGLSSSQKLEITFSFANLVSLIIKIACPSLQTLNFLFPAP